MAPKPSCTCVPAWGSCSGHPRTPGTWRPPAWVGPQQGSSRWTDLHAAWAHRQPVAKTGWKDQGGLQVPRSPPPHLRADLHPAAAPLRLDHAGRLHRQPHVAALARRHLPKLADHHPGDLHILCAQPQVPQMGISGGAGAQDAAMQWPDCALDAQGGHWAVIQCPGAGGPQPAPPKRCTAEGREGASRRRAPPTWKLPASSSCRMTVTPWGMVPAPTHCALSWTRTSW